MNSFGKNIRISIFGESHGPIIGITIDGLPVNYTINKEAVDKALAKRLGPSDISTARREPDNWQIISGYFNNHTTGAPLTIIIPNHDIDDSGYQNAGNIRPSQSDLTTFLKYHGANDHLGGGHASGRLTAVLVILGAIAKDLLNYMQITVVPHLSSLKDIEDKKITFEEANLSTLLPLVEKALPVIDPRAEKLMVSTIKRIKKQQDALGGTLEVYVFNVPHSLGEPFFDSFESILSHLMFSIPGIKGIEFGDGFEMTKRKASESIDELAYEKDQIVFSSNHQGGINGGITNGNFLKFKLAIKAPSSIATPLNSINVISKENITVSTIGRHDPCIVHRIIPVVEALTYYTILEMVKENER